MKNGDLANSMSITFAFRCEDFLIRYKDDTPFDKVANFVRGKENRAYIDPVVAKVVEFIFRQTEYTADVVIQKENYIKLKHLLDNLPFNRVVEITKPPQVTSRLMMGDITYYVDNDLDRLSLINSEFAITLDEVFPIINSMKLR